MCNTTRGLALRLHWLGPEIVPLVRGLGRSPRSPRRVVPASCQCADPDCDGLVGAARPLAAPGCVRPAWPRLGGLMLPPWPPAVQDTSGACRLARRRALPSGPAGSGSRELPRMPRQDLARDLVGSAAMAALEQRPEGFDPVRMHGAPAYSPALGCTASCRYPSRPSCDACLSVYTADSAAAHVVTNSWRVRVVLHISS